MTNRSLAQEPPLGPRIRRLPPDAVNRIAAGEVIERPAAVVKELVENALDAGARNIEIDIREGGKAGIAVFDDGCGMGPVDLPLCVERHATSKLAPSALGDYDLANIATLGFRGEALPSIGAVAKLDITSRASGEPEAWKLSVHGGKIAGPAPAAMSGRGTRIEVRDLFYATPARLKFLKSERAESAAVSEAVKRLAMAYSGVRFSLTSEGRRLFVYQAGPGDDIGGLGRLAAIMGRDFADNALPVEAARASATLRGFIGLPTFNRGLPDRQFLFVNGRPVRDKLIVGALRAAYADFLARDRHPAAALFLELDPELVDVNVHPAKSEVRFRDPAEVRGLLVGAMRHALAAAGHRASTTTGAYALSRLRPGSAPARQETLAGTNIFAPLSPGLGDPQRDFAQYENPFAKPGARIEGAVEEPQSYPLGAARAQLHETYIVAQTADGLVIVDQHAAHERLVHERMKAALATGAVPQQVLLLPEVVDLDEEQASRLVERAGELAELGLAIEKFGEGAVLVRATPALLGDVDIQGMIRELADDLSEIGAGRSLKEQLEDVCGAMACRRSVRAGRALARDEMDALLREMETTPHSGQCNHGRPTYVELKLADIERLFGRR